jgi:hypothetical protein
MAKFLGILTTTVLRAFLLAAVVLVVIYWIGEIH